MLKQYGTTMKEKYKQPVIEEIIDNMFHAKKDKRNIDIYIL